MASITTGYGVVELGWTQVSVSLLDHDGVQLYPFGFYVSNLFSLEENKIFKDFLEDVC